MPTTTTVFTLFTVLGRDGRRKTRAVDPATESGGGVTAARPVGNWGDMWTMFMSTTTATLTMLINRINSVLKTQVALRWGTPFVKAIAPRAGASFSTWETQSLRDARVTRGSSCHQIIDVAGGRRTLGQRLCQTRTSCHQSINVAGGRRTLEERLCQTRTSCMDKMVDLLIVFAFQLLAAGGLICLMMATLHHDDESTDFFVYGTTSRSSMYLTELLQGLTSTCVLQVFWTHECSVRPEHVSFFLSLHRFNREHSCLKATDGL